MQVGFYRDTWVEVNLDAIEHNVRKMKKHIGEKVKLIAVVKANGYGHGAKQVAESALHAGASMLAVAFIDEAISLRQQGIKAPILVLGAIRAADIEIAGKFDLILTCFSIEWLKEASENCESQGIHLHIKVDTGMGRLGVREEHELKEIVEFVDSSPYFQITGIFTHFATADEDELSYFLTQYERFQQFLSVIDHEQLLVHCANSATGLKFPSKLYNAVRLGISMYGLSPSVEMKNKLPFTLEEAFSLQTRLVHVKKVPKGTKISYGATYETQQDEWIGTLPIGYADGWIRKLKDSEVLIDGKRLSLVGRICMDQCMVRLPYELPVDTKVTLIGEQKGQKISIDEVAKRLDTINYEIPCMISTRVPRTYLKDKQISEQSNPLLTNMSKES
ncbi:alanine racemase [Metabacillus halosaccharovorans]|uniref:alanine racemase n=1 Tax=Metabacillus halosaccharovorans TaxID=930124 RepID=UPI00203EB7BD|nr:alanine racemase [Metabacillus halosaccharovorans]MCM3444678.1 alanine racemase [Metabacillus halosaccharovorans]